MLTYLMHESIQVERKVTLLESALLLRVVPQIVEVMVIVLWTGETAVADTWTGAIVVAETWTGETVVAETWTVTTNRIPAHNDATTVVKW
jgi:hypothetical protein